jgi:hypothetical protein
MLWRALPIALLAACAAGPPAAPDTGARDTSGAIEVVVELPPGTLLGVDSVEVVGDSDPDNSLWLGGLWREALRASQHFDISAGVESGTPTASLSLQLDRASLTLTSTLHETLRPPTPLASSSFAADRAAASIAELARRTCLALGEPAATAPLPQLAQTYSDSRACVVATERALRAFAGGDLETARGQLTEARRADSGCALALLAAAELELRAGDAQRAQRLSDEGLGLASRSSATVRHRLARATLLGRSTAGGVEPRRLDQQLLALGEAFARERPHDPHGRFTQAQALVLLGRFSEAEPLLATLRGRWPKLTQAAYQHGLALLGAGHADAALLALAEVTDRLSPLQTATPLAIALFGADRHADLIVFLNELAARADVQGSLLLHHVRRMQASHAILQDRAADAAALLLADLEWLRQRSSRLGQFADHLASTCQVLVMLGKGREVTRAVAAFERLPYVEEAARRALAFAGGLAEVAATNQPASVAEATLSKEGESAWSHLLRAAAHRARGELAEETRALLEAAQRDRSPLLRASLARALRTAGDTQRAGELLAALRADLSRLDVRRLAEHPLLDPAHALALLATR